MPPKKRIKEVIIKKNVDDVLKLHFDDTILNLNLPKIKQLYDTGVINNQMFQFLKAVQSYQQKENEGKYELRYNYKLEDDRIKMTQDLNDAILQHFNNQIKNVKVSTLNELVKKKKITKEIQKQLIKLKKAYNKGVLDEVLDYGEFDKPDLEQEQEDDPIIQEQPASNGAEEVGVKSDDSGDTKQVKEVLNELVGDVASYEELEEYSPDSPRYDEEGKPLPYDDPERSGKYKQRMKEGKYLLAHRKAFVDFVNTDFYKEILRQSKDPSYNESKLRYGQDTPSSLNVYQILVREYLSVETPYRGLLVYHGLGTGKTATAVSMAEKASSDMKITTLLPASLETNFIGEVKQWGKNELDIQGQHWTFIPIKTIEETASTRKMLFDKYQVTAEVLKQIMNHTIREVKQVIKLQLIEEDPTLQDKKAVLLNKMKREYKKISTGVLAMKGFWTHGKTGTKFDDLDPLQQTYLECQVHKLIQLKYNFIHYNPLPTIKEQDIEQIEGLDEYEAERRGNALIKQKLLQRLNYNIQNYEVPSPFYEETIVIDEVHNFVREVVNDSGSARQFYEWIVNAERVKLVFLSGTPIINKPSEIAILYNMLKGRQKIYTFTVQSTMDPNELTNQLNDIFYKKKSPIELFHVSRLEGKLILSFTMNQETFVSTMNPTNKVIYTSSEHKYTYEDFINAIYTGLSNVFEEKDITPTQKDATKSKHKPIRFDKQLDIPFYRSQTLFEIKENGQMIDLTNNEVFMDYFFLDNFEISDVKRTLLRRMMMGLTSYYPIDRSKIGSMPTVVNPQVTQGYSHYTIAQKMTVETCMMSSLQFSKYIEVWRQEKKKDLVRQMRRHLHEELPFDFNIRTRQICNMIYKDDEFRYIKDGDRARGKKIEQYEELKQSRSLEYEQQLIDLSPKLHRILTNIMKFREGIQSKGKVLIYSDFRGDSGGEIVEQVLMANGYSLFDPTQPPTNSLKYTFITGEESVDQRKKNMAAFNDKSNKYGEQIQIMIISGAGAEGISLTCVRQVHILEPYWNFVRIDQVFGRAIRLFSHDDLDPKDRNVEEYIYLSVLPSGSSVEEIYQSIEGWDVVPKLKDVKTELAQGKNKELKDTIDMIQNIGQSVDQKIFDIMEKKYKVSENMINIIKESSLDCIQHTRDDPEINDRCIRFSNMLLNEIAYFPGISADELFLIDLKQLKASFLLFMKPDTYVVGTGDNQYIYYQSDKPDMDIRYLRENAKKLCTLSMNEGNIYVFAGKDHDLNEELGKHFSVYQDMYSLEKYVDSIEDKKFPSFKTIVSDEKIGYKIKFNLNELMFFSPHEDNTLRRLYRFDEYIAKQMVKPLLICDKEVFIQD